MLQAARNTGYFHTCSTLSCLGCFHWPVPFWRYTPRSPVPVCTYPTPFSKIRLNALSLNLFSWKLFASSELSSLSFSLFSPWCKVFLLLFYKLCVISSWGKTQKTCVKRREIAWEKIMLLSLQCTYWSPGNLAKSSFWFSRSGLRPEVHF